MPDLKKRYIISLLAIAFLVILGNIFIAQKLHSQINDSRIVNIAGRQRMLSQRISKTVLEIRDPLTVPDKEMHLQELEVSLALWEISHNGLKNGNEEIGLPGENSEHVNKLFLELEPKFQTIRENAHLIINTNAQEETLFHYSALILANEQAFLKGMDEIVFQYDAEAKTRVEKLHKTELLILFLILLILFIEGMLVFHPAIKKLKQIDEAKTEFVSLASHQLKAPLTALNWYAEMILNGDAGRITKEQKTYLHEIIASKKRMTSLADALLNISRIEMGTLAINPKPTNIAKLIKSTLFDFNSEIQEKQIKVTTTFSKKIPKISVDPNLTRVVFQNLLSNAIKYTPKHGSISINLSNNNRDILFQIQDSGCGIPQEQQKHIFSKLFRADNTKDIEGNGLGLYIVKSVIETMNGSIWFTSEENEGTTFFITIPIVGVKKQTGSKSLQFTK